MPDVCDQGAIDISPELKRVLQAHNDREYMLSWFAGMVRTYVHKDAIAKVIRIRYIEKMQDNIEYYGPDRGDNYIDTATRFAVGAGLFLDHLRELSFSDIDILRQMEPKETVYRPIRSIGGREINYA